MPFTEDSLYLFISLLPCPQRGSNALSAARIKTPRAGGAIRALLRKGGAPHLPEEAEPDEARDVTVGLEAGFLFEAL